MVKINPTLGDFESRNAVDDFDPNAALNRDDQFRTR